MEIVIENDPYRASGSSGGPAPAYLRSPVTNQQPIVNSSSAFYYATLPRGGACRMNPAPELLDGASTTSVRRVDKSGLLEIADLEPVGRQTSSRHLTGAESHGTLSRRIERSGLLEAVPEVPDHCHRVGLASDELLAAAATTRSMVERQQHLLGAETDVVESALLRRRSYATDSQDSSTSNQTENDSGIGNPTRSGQRVKFAADESIGALEPETKESRKTSVVDCLGRLSPRHRERHGPMTLSNIPDVIEAHGSSTATSAATTTAAATSGGGNANGTPEGERAEAEGCEHTAIESVEEARVSFKGSADSANSKLPHNDNIQAVHVIILSEQL